MLSPDQVLAAAPNVALALLGIAVLLMLLSLRLFSRSRTDSFWRRRRAAGQQGTRVFVVSAIMLVFSAATCAISTFGPRLLTRSASPTAANIAAAPTDDLTLTAIFVPTQLETPSETPTSIVATDTAMPSLTPIPASATTQPSSTGTATATETLAPTETATATSSETPSLETANSIAARSATKELPSATTTVTASNTATAVPPTLTATVTATLVPTTVIPPSATLTRTATPTQTVTYTATPTASLTPTPLPPTATPTSTPSETPTLPPTDTMTPSPSVTPTLIAIFQPPILTSSVTPSGKSKMNITAITSQITADLKPIDPSRDLPIGITRIYFFVDFSDMQPGVLWRRELLNDQDVLMSNAYLWGQTQAGTTFFYFGQPNGFAAGNYQIRLFLGSGDQPIATADFNVK